MSKKYVKLNQIEHVLKRPDVYIGSTRSRQVDDYVVIKEKDGIYLQVASLKEKSSADTKAASINKKKINANVIEADLGSKGKYYRVRIGPFKTIDEAKTAANKIE